MPKAKIESGISWGHLKIIKEEVSVRIRELGDGIGFEEKLVYYLAQCTCGKTVKIWEDEWKGKQATKDCGCGISNYDGAVVRLTVSMPLLLNVQIKNHADEKKITVSQAVVNFARSALKEENDEKTG